MPSRKPPGKGKGGRAGGRIENGKKPFGKPSSPRAASSRPDREDRDSRDKGEYKKPAAGGRSGAAPGPRAPRSENPSTPYSKPDRAAHRAAKPEGGVAKSGRKFGTARADGGKKFSKPEGREEKGTYKKPDTGGFDAPREYKKPETKFERPARAAKATGSSYSSFRKQGGSERSEDGNSKPDRKPRDKNDGGLFKEVRPKATEGRFAGNVGSEDTTDSTWSAEKAIKPRVAGAFGSKLPADRAPKEDKRKLPETKRFGGGKGSKASGKPRKATVDFNKPKKNTTNKKKDFKNPSAGPTPPTEDGATRLNKYLAHAGVAARRAADEIIADGDVTVNGEVVLEMGYRVKPGDVVKYNGKTVKPVRNMVYILLNKPKDYITTTSDDLDRHTVMELVATATDERVYPVGRLDRNTTGLLLMTNDGDLAQKLSHPSRKMKKIYHVVLDKPISEDELEQIAKGLVLEDGVAQIDAISYADRKDKTQVGIELHIGKNRIVRRIFEYLKYDVVKLDRVFYGGLTKKDLPRGRWRHLEEKEVIMLKHFI